MTATHTLAEVAAMHLPAEWKDGVRWLKRRLAAGEIPGKRLNRNTWVMTDAHIEQWLNTPTAPEPVAAQPEPLTVIDGLSTRSRKRLA
jgi:hypothetical protein